MNKFKWCILLLMVVSCNQSMKFDSVKWKTKDDMEYPYREKMLVDLTKNNNLAGLHYTQLVELLGKPQFVDSTVMVYQVSIDYGRDIDPVYTKYLDLNLTNDSIVKSFKINEWKK